MASDLLRAIRAERLKLRRTLTSWAVVGSALFVPAIMLAVRYHNAELTSTMARSGTFWRQHWLQSWESIAVLILPLATILVTTLAVHVETRNDTWKQLHATPLSLPVIYLAKLIVLIALLLATVLLIDLGLFLAGWIPLRTQSIPGGPFPVAEIARWNVRFFVDTLPIVGLQYALALRFRNVLVPLGLGIAGWVAGLVVINTRYVVAVPYAYVGVDYLVVLGHRAAASLPVPIPLLAGGAFVIVMLAGFAAYAWSRDRAAAR